MDLSSQDRPYDEDAAGPSQEPVVRTASNRPWSADFANPLPVSPPRRVRPLSELTVTPSNQTRPLRIRRLPSDGSIVTRSQQTSGPAGDEDEQGEAAGRRRSLSAPQRPTRVQMSTIDSRRDQNIASHLLPVMEEADGQSVHQASLIQGNQQQPLTPPPTSGGVLRRASNAALSVLAGRSRGNSINRRPRATSSVDSTGLRREYNHDVIDFLDVIDPEVSTLTTLNNVQNSLFIPYLGPFLNRQGTYNLTREITEEESLVSETETEVEAEPESPAATSPQSPQRVPTATDKSVEAGEGLDWDSRPDSRRDSIRPLTRTDTLSSVLSGTSIGHRYAVLPHGTVLEGWTAQDKAVLNDHVRHLLHSRRARFKRGMKAFGKYVRTPLGFFVTLYAFLLTFWGAAWVFFLIGWISAGDRQKYFIEICDQILTALFAVVGLGLAPFRIVDTYHMIYIAHYHYLTWELRRKRGLPELIDPNELPAPTDAEDLELAHAKGLEASVLTAEQQRKLVHHQAKFSKSHTFYKAHETYTHRAFSIKLLITIVVLLDCHSLFQMALGGTTWGIYYKHRPKALTAVILTCSICCNISGGVLISVGDRLSRKTEVVTQLARQALTEEAMKKMTKKNKSLRTFTRVKGSVPDGGGGGERKKAKSKKRLSHAKKLTTTEMTPVEADRDEALR